MKHFFSRLAIFSFLFALTTSAVLFADDNVSVIVNGKAYQCSQSVGEVYRYGCQCNPYSGHWELGYYKFNIANGEAAFIKYIGTTFYQDQQSCLTQLSFETLCKN